MLTVCWMKNYEHSNSKQPQPQRRVACGLWRMNGYGSSDAALCRGPWLMRALDAARPSAKWLFSWALFVHFLVTFKGQVEYRLTGKVEVDVEIRHISPRFTSKFQIRPCTPDVLCWKVDWNPTQTALQFALSLSSTLHLTRSIKFQSFLNRGNGSKTTLSTTKYIESGGWSKNSNLWQEQDYRWSTSTMITLAVDWTDEAANNNWIVSRTYLVDFFMEMMCSEDLSLSTLWPRSDHLHFVTWPISLDFSFSPFSPPA